MCGLKGFLFAILLYKLKKCCYTEDADSLFILFKQTIYIIDIAFMIK